MPTYLFATADALLNQAIADDLYYPAVRWLEKKELPEILKDAPPSYRRVFLFAGYEQFLTEEYMSVMSGSDWADMLLDHPQFIDKCDVTLLEAEDWNLLLGKHPHLTLFRPDQARSEAAEKAVKELQEVLLSSMRHDSGIIGSNTTQGCLAHLLQKCIDHLAACPVTQGEQTSPMISGAEGDPEIYRAMCISTCHITLEERNWLQEDAELNSVEPNGQLSTGSFGHGYIIPIYTDRDYEYDLDEAKIPAGILSLMQYASDNSAQYLVLDCDGPIVKSLPKYDW